MAEIFLCDTLYPGTGDGVLSNHAIVVEDGTITQLVPRDSIVPGKVDVVHDLSGRFVMPGLIDVHTHLAYGNAKSEEDIDLYAAVELRAVRAAFFAHQVLAAGVTSMIAPGDAGLVSSAVRDAVDAGLFEGPRISTAGPYITSRQGLTDWYPTWIGVPTTSIGRLVTSLDEAIEEIRRQAKDGVDAIKIALDGFQRRPDGELVAAFTQQETTAMVEEIRRQGKISICHARGREATLYAGRAGMDLIFHASYMDDEALDAVVRNGCAISPTLTFLRNSIDFMQPTDPMKEKGRDEGMKQEYDTAVTALRKAREAGVPMPTGTDSGFAITPYGEWHARELEIYVDDLGFSPIEAIRSATSVSAKLVRPKDRVGVLAPGYAADLLVLRSDPTRDVSVLLDAEQFETVYLGGLPTTPPRQPHALRKVSDFVQTMFSDVYTRARVAELHNRIGLQRKH